MAVETAPPPPSIAALASAPSPSAPPATHVDRTEPTTLDAPKPGSARERMRKAMDEKYGGTPPTPDAKPKTPETAKAPETTPKRPGEKTPDEPSTTQSSEAPADIPPDQKKKNPWVLYREEKARAQKLEQQITETKSASLAETEKAQFQERIDKAEAKLKEYEDEIRFKSYEKSDEFKTKYEQPYEQAWTKHVHDLQGVSVMEDGNPRPMVPNDILDLVNLSLPDARKLANEKWGDFAQDAMAARKEIKDLFESKTKALDEARKTGADREKTFQENAKKWRDGVQKQIKDTWDTSNKAALDHPINGEFFKPAEGDDTRNQLLGKGFALVDEAFGKNPSDPKLTPEERAAIVKKHAAVRNRAAAFGPMKYLIAKLREKLAALEKSNGEFKASTPPAGGGTAAPGGGAPGGGSAATRMRAAGDKYAR